MIRTWKRVRSVCARRQNTFHEAKGKGKGGKPGGKAGGKVMKSNLTMADGKANSAVMRSDTGPGMQL